MANNEFDNGMEYKQRKDSRMVIHNTGINLQLLNPKRVNKMAQAKMIWLLCDLLGIPLTILGILANMDNIKSAIIAVLGITYLMVRMYFYVTKAKQDVREKEFNLWHLEKDKEERQAKLKKDKENGA